MDRSTFDGSYERIKWKEQKKEINWRSFLDLILLDYADLVQTKVNIKNHPL